MTTSQLDHNIAYVSRWVEKRYPHFVDRADLASELVAYTMTGGARVLARCAERGDNYRALRYLFGVARSFAEQEKAQKTGHIFADTAWYSPWRVDTLMPLASNPEWDERAEGVDGLVGATVAKEGGDITAMVMDVRRALRACGSTNEDDDGPAFYDEHMLVLSEFLGGDYPGAPGYDRDWRESLSNEEARNVTDRAESLWESRSG